jgi:hypothetical protein
LVYDYIRCYDYNPSKFVFHKVDNEEELYLEIELEVDHGGEKDNIAKQVIDFMNYIVDDNVYCKHDGSLDNGFEIVTHPCTLEYHRQLPYQDLFKYLTDKGYKSHDTTTCGLHIHFNRNFFGKSKLEQDLCISKLLYLFEKNWGKVEKIARRSANRYAVRCNLYDNESPIDLYAKSKDTEKYCAINLEHRDTVEIRIFKGTLKYETFINTLEFVNKMVHIAKDTDIYNIQNVTWDNIVTHFSDELISYIDSKVKESEAIAKEMSEIDRTLAEIMDINTQIARAEHARDKRILRKRLAALNRKLSQLRRERNRLLQERRRR